MTWNDRPIWLYVTDWLVAMFFFAIGGATQGFLEPRDIEFVVNSEDINKPYVSETLVSSVMLLTIAFLIPPFVFFVCFLISKYQYRRLDLYYAMLGWFFALSLEILFQGTMAVYTGSLRPDFIERCNPDYNSTKIRLCPGSNFALCANTKDLSEICLDWPESEDGIQDARKSFFSGHASLSFASFVFLSLYLAGYTKTFYGNPDLWKFLLIVPPVLGACYISISRVYDFRHTGIDVFWGSLDGLLAAILVYFTYYPWLQSPNTGVPRPALNGEQGKYRFEMSEKVNLNTSELPMQQKSPQIL